MKRNLLAAPFERAFNEQQECEKEGKTECKSELMSIHYREEEAIYVKSNFDRITVIFSTTFKDETDKIFGKVFLQVTFFLSILFYAKLTIGICGCSS